MKKTFISILAFFILFSPVLVAQAGLVPSCGEIDPATRQINNPCDFNYFMELINNIITFVLFYLATPLFAILFAYAGFLYLFAGTSENRVGKAKTILKNALFGYLVALAAWLIVKTIMISLGFTNAGQFLNIIN
ncbi:MAG: hypothetical protein U9R00_00575 [Patescibacteria group bacterium]|nr:hypothetical protein [Patescibacteria group bacterium]